MESKIKATGFTVLISLLSSVLTIFLNLIYNNYIMRIYGSSINGLISTLLQFVTLFTIIEGGFTTASVIATYEPIVKKQYNKLNDILYTTKIIYYRIGVIIIVLAMIIGSIYINFIESPLSYNKTYILLIITVFSAFVSLSIQSKNIVLLQGLNKEYIQLLFMLISKIITWIISIIMIHNNNSIILIYSINILNAFLTVCFSFLYVKKFLSYVSYKGNYNKSLIKGSGDVLFQKISNTLTSSMDLVLISLYTGFAEVSVYNLYQLIFRAVANLLFSIVQAPFNSFGHLLKEGNRTRFNQYFKLYQKLVAMISTIFLTITTCTVLSFIKIYTKDVADINYDRFILSILFFMQYFMQINNRPYGMLLNITGNFRIQNMQCVLSNILNITISIVSLKRFGINGVIFGTFIGTSFIMIINILQCYKYKLIDGIIKQVINNILNFIIAFVVILIFKSLEINTSNYLGWILFALISLFLCSLIVIFLNIIFDCKSTKETLMYIYKIILKSKKI